MENIIIFVIFAIISSLFNKDKKPKKIPKKSTSPVEYQSKDNRTQKPSYRRGALGDLIKEFKSDFDNVFREKPYVTQQREGYNQEEKASDAIEYDYRGYVDASHNNSYFDGQHQETIKKYEKDKTNAKTIDDRKTTINDNEIEDAISGLTLTFNEETLLQGIIMSEVLGKPKALRR